MDDYCKDESMKRGIAISTLALLLITLVVGAGLGNFVYKLSKNISEKSLIERCRTSMFFISQSRQRLGKLEAGAPELPQPDCPFANKTFSGKQQDVVAGIAEEMRLCWDKTLGIRNNLGFSYYPWFFGGDREQDICLVCAEFTLDQDLDVKQIQQFFETKKIVKGEGVGKLFMDYLQTNWKRDSAGKASETSGKTVARDLFFAFSSQNTRAHPNNDERITKFAVLEKGKTYYVLDYNSGKGKGVSDEYKYTHVFVTPAEGIQNMHCDMFHYQYEK